MKRKTKKTDDPDVTTPEFWDSIGFDLIEIRRDGKIVARDTVTKSEIKFNADWSPLRIAIAVCKARAQWLK